MPIIELTKGKTALVDDEDFERVNCHKWHATRSGCKWYAQRKINGKQVYMHRFIMNAPKGKQVDHVNGNGLDNRRDNLRLCTPSQNCRNRGKTAASKSGFKGVFWAKKSKKWTAQIMIHGKGKHLGNYSTPQDAARAYDAAARELHREFAKLNFKKEKTA